MDRPLMFLQSLLVLMMAIHAISACKCGKKTTMEEAVCNNLTLIMGTPMSAEFLDARLKPVNKPEDADLIKYTVFLHVMYHEGPNRIREHDYFPMLTPLKTEVCGVEFEMHKAYFIAGTHWNKNLLVVHSCDYVESVPWDEKTHEEFEAMNDLLTRQTALECKKS